MNRPLRDNKGRPLTPADKKNILRNIYRNWGAHSHIQYKTRFGEPVIWFLNAVRFHIGLDQSLNEREVTRVEIQFRQCPKQTLFTGPCTRNATKFIDGIWICATHARYHK